jgi:predicted nucleic acid-binding Zn ribbon protein
MVAQARVDSMQQMRQSGATLDQVGSCFGITRERVRWLLTEHYGSTKVQNLLTATELARLAGCSYSYIDKLKRRGVIQPAMVVGHGRTLWDRESVVAVIEYIDRDRCPVCQQPVPGNRQVYCSRECYLEAHRYKNQPKEAKRQHDEMVKWWLAEHPEKARQIQQQKQARQQARRSWQRYQAAETRALGFKVKVYGYETGNKGF